MEHFPISHVVLERIFYQVYTPFIIFNSRMGMPFKYSQDMRKFHENMMRENFLFQDDATCQACVVFEEKLAGVLKCSVVNLVI